MSIYGNICFLWTQKLTFYMWARDNWEDNLQRNTFKDSSFIFQGSLPSSIEENTSQKQGRGGREGGYGVKSNDNIASMEQTNQLSDHPLAIDAVNVEGRRK